jgi:hypothetical protein
MSNERGSQSPRTAVTFTIPGDPVPQPRPRYRLGAGMAGPTCRPNIRCTSSAPALPTPLRRLG